MFWFMSWKLKNVEYNIINFRVCYLVDGTCVFEFWCLSIRYSLVHYLVIKGSTLWLSCFLY